MTIFIFTYFLQMHKQRIRRQIRVSALNTIHFNAQRLPELINLHASSKNINYPPVY